MIYCKELNKEFDNKQDLFKALLSNKQMILDNKKSEIKTKSNTSVLGFVDMKNNTVKGVPNMDDDYIYPIISNTNYLDSHKDVHLNGSMTKTAKEQNRKVYYVADHKLEVDSIIATPKNVEVTLQTLKWSDLGRNYDGETEALIYKIKKSEIMHDKFLKMINKGEDLQNSIRMQYVKLDFGFDSNEDEYKAEKEVYDEVYNTIVNKEALENEPYFFAVRELKLTMEGSAVLFGSNDATPINNKTEADTDVTPAIHEPSKDTHKTIINPNLF